MIKQETPAPWIVGERVVIDRRFIGEIERVTPTGCAIANGKQFCPNGVQITSNRRVSRLERLTPTIEAEMDMSARAARANDDCFKAIDEASTFLREEFGRWYNGKFEPNSTSDVEKIERIVVAIRLAMEDPA